MAVIALTSASGSPGVTTTALGLALLWPRPVLLVEADPTGGSGLLAGYFRGTREYDGGLIELALTSSSIHDALAEVVRTHRRHQRLVRRRHPVAHPGSRAARSLAAARRRNWPTWSRPARTSSSMPAGSDSSAPRSRCSRTPT